jgi:thymidylate kinase
MFIAPNGNQCALVVIEGPDKMGKATQSALLLSNLTNLGVRVTQQEIAANDGITYDKIYRMLKSGDASRFPSTFQAFHTSNRLIWQAQQLPQLGSKYDVLILDRWTISSSVYGRASGVDDDEINCLCEDLVTPDLVFVFHGKSFTTPERADDCYEADTEFQTKVRHEYDYWAETNPEVAVPIDANRERDDIGRDILLTCRERLML